MEMPMKLRIKCSQNYLNLTSGFPRLGMFSGEAHPTAFDRILASRLGMAAVEGLVNGKKGMMVGIVDNQIQYTNFKIAITKSKPINEDMLRMVKILSI